MSGRTLLVAGANGRLGRRVVELLRTGERVVATTRSPERAADLVRDGVEIRFADFDQPGSLDRAFAGVDRLLLISTGSDPTRRRRLARHRAVIEAAQRSGVTHVVYTSISSPRPTPEPSLFDDHWQTERCLAESALDWTVLRNNLYADQFFDTLPVVVEFGRLTAIAPAAPVGYVLRDDCARACAAALSAETGGRRVLDITGSAVIDRQTIATVAGELCGREVVPVTTEPVVLRQNLLRLGMWEHVADALVDIELAVAEGRHAVVSTDFEDLTGKRPRGVLDALHDNLPALLASCASLRRRVTTC
ncbi:NAD(P)H dehydrogenase (quinone) [Lentzea fradiae]|uniref:NAD(P)H dehydrogenase (Quinone) n=1 Tax=Lentzea fradiae TaxID=200378 RepID=A0A1G8BGF9_9PSEU|nr:NAD(P)H-binding protein [Lentzea fradiae]SDH32336.1 NAD(P)H dehydrogenase (quinone) [Lentzea fradiae]